MSGADIYKKIFDALDQEYITAEEFYEVQQTVNTLDTSVDNINSTGALPIKSGRYVMSGNTSLPHATNVVVEFDTTTSEDFDGDVSLASNTFTINTAGKYYVNALIEFSTNTAGYRAVFVRQNGGNVLSLTEQPVGGTTTRVSFTSPLLVLSAADTIDVVGYQNSNSPMTISNVSTYINVIRLA